MLASMPAIQRSEDEPAWLLCEGQCRKPTLHAFKCRQSVLHERWSFTVGIAVLYQCTKCRHSRRWGLEPVGTRVKH